MRISLRFPMSSLRSRPTWLRIGFYLWAFWTLVGVTYASIGYVAYLAVDSVPGQYSFLWVVLGWYTWIPATLIVVWMAQRFPIERQRWFYAIPLHVFGAAATSLFASFLYTCMRGTALLFSGMPFDFSERMLDVFTRSVALDSIIYLTALVGVSAFQYYRKYRERELRTSQLEAELAAAQLHALKLQLQPHFLFNTFHTIAMLVRQQRDDEAVDTIAVLSDFLRYVLDNTGAQEVTLHRELDFLESYVAIEHIRFKDQLRVETDIDPAAVNASVPNLLLQPLVENAVRHGIEPSPRPGRIHVDARREGDQLRIRVRDNGIGLPDDWRMDDCRGVGLANTEARLRRLYGNDFRFELTNGPSDEGVLATIVIPYRTPTGQPMESSPEFSPRTLIPTR